MIPFILSNAVGILTPLKSKFFLLCPLSSHFAYSVLCHLRAIFIIYCQIYQYFPYCFWIFEFWLGKFSLFPDFKFSHAAFFQLLYDFIFIQKIFLPFFIYLFWPQHSFGILFLNQGLNLGQCRRRLSSNHWTARNLYFYI